MESSDLRVFEAVARLGSITAASDELHTVQSNVTARIRALEDQLGTALFRRHSRGVVLTRAGERLLPYAVQIAQLLKDAVNIVGKTSAPRKSSDWLARIHRRHSLASDPICLPAEIS